MNIRETPPTRSDKPVFPRLVKSTVYFPSLGKACADLFILEKYTTMMRKFRGKTWPPFIAALLFPVKNGDQSDKKERLKDRSIAVFAKGADIKLSTFTVDIQSGK